MPPKNPGNGSGQLGPKPFRRLPLHWLGLLPFLIFALLFLILPTMKIVVGAFQTPDGGFTFQNIADLNTDSIRASYITSIKLSLIAAALGCLIGFAMAAGMVLGLSLIHI